MVPARLPWVSVNLTAGYPLEMQDYCFPSKWRCWHLANLKAGVLCGSHNSLSCPIPAVSTSYPLTPLTVTNTVLCKKHIVNKGMRITKGACFVARGATINITIPEVNQLFFHGWPFLLGTSWLTHCPGEAAQLAIHLFTLLQGPSAPPSFSCALQRLFSSFYSCTVLPN